jgi:hypothetical protein
MPDLFLAAREGDVKNIIGFPIVVTGVCSGYFIQLHFCRNITVRFTTRTAARMLADKRGRSPDIIERRIILI